MIANPTKPAALHFCAEFSKELINVGHTVFFNDAMVKAIPDAVIIAGGDGTVLQHVETLRRFGAPLLGINFGNRGYLTSCEPADAKAWLEKIMENQCAFDERTLLEGEIISPESNAIAFSGLNEAVIHRGTVSRPLTFTLYLNDDHIVSFNADGIIVATPTGSTAYSLSAGGPILLPQARNFLITPICSNGFFRNSIVASDTDRIKIAIEPPEPLVEGERPMLTIDGREKHYISFSDEILIQKAADTLRIYNCESVDFLKILERKVAQI